MKKRLIGSIPLLLCLSCTVLEDRVPCPCYLDIDYREVLAAAWGEQWEGCVDVTLRAPEPVWSENRRMGECPDIEEVAVEKARILVVGLVHNRPMRDFLGAGTQLVYEAGNQIDSLYVHTEEVDCTGEEAHSILRPHKQFSTLFITDEAGGDLCRPYNLVIRGTTCGFDAADFSAIDGTYLYTVQEKDGTGRISVRVPRQKRSDLVLEFWDKEDHLKRFSSPVGLYLFAAGYDPDAPDLPDYEIRIDFRQALLYLRVSDWEEEHVFSLYD
ncbi:MAG: hypothetical protein IKX53_02435 [Bacteroidales bacterium]|nr:hypothetical protein [Bacteroidales bacterium]